MLLPLVFMLFITIVVDIYLCIVSRNDILNCTIYTPPFKQIHGHDDKNVTIEPEEDGKLFRFFLNFFPLHFFPSVFLWSFSVLIFNAYTEDALVKMKRNMTKKNEQTLLEESVCRMFDGKWGNCRNENLCMSAFYVPPHRCRSNEKRSHWMVVIVVGVVFLSLLLVVIIFELHAASYYIIFGIY